MASQDWSERRQRMVKCKAHGLHYDPKIASGCSRCLKEASQRHAPRAPQLTIILLCALGIAAAQYQIFGPGGIGSASDAQEATDVATGTARLDPEPHRAVIQAVEAALFAPVEDEVDLAALGASVFMAATSLSRSLRQHDPENGSGGADAVTRLVRSIGEGFSFRELERLRDGWLLFRERYLGAASWFATPERAGSASERVMIAEYRLLSSNLMSLLEEGASEAQVAAAASDSADRKARWQAFQADWRERIGELWKNQPRRPGSEADPHILVAIQELERAFHRTWALASDRSLAQSRDPGARFDDVLELLRKSQQAFDDVQL